MNPQRWFLCRRSMESTGDDLTELRRSVRELYRDELADEFGLIMVMPAPDITGFDKLAIRLSYVRLVKQITEGYAVTMTASGLVLGLLADDPGLTPSLYRLHDAMVEISPQGRQPRLLWERLPDFEASALIMLDELSG